MRYLARTWWIALAAAAPIAGAWLLRDFFGDSVQTVGASKPNAPRDTNGQAVPLLINPADIDLGLIKEPTTHVFTAENRGTSLIEIAEVRGSCACVRSDVKAHFLAPGEKTTVNVRVSPLRDRVGIQEFPIDVVWMSGEKRSTRLTIKTKFQPDVIVPERLDLRSIAGKGGSAYFSLTDFREKPLDIRKISTTSKSLSVEVAEYPAAYHAGWRYRFVVTDRGDRKNGATGELVILETTDPERETIEVRVAVEQISRLRVSPPTVTLAQGSAGGRPSAKIWIDDVEGAALKLGAVSASDGSFTYQTDLGDARLAKIELASSGAKTSGAEKAELRVEVLEPVREVLCIPVVYR